MAKTADVPAPPFPDQVRRGRAVHAGDERAARQPHPAPAEFILIRWGIVPGLTDDVKNRDCNWTRASVQAALDSFIDHFTGGVRGDGVSLRPLSKGKHLADNLRRKFSHLVEPAPAPSTDIKDRLTRHPTRHVRV